MTWSGGNSIVYGVAWRACHIVWPDGHGMVYMAWRAWHVIWYDLEGMTWFMVWPGRHGI